jgi:hypothetical protein
MNTQTIYSDICEDFINVCLSVIAENKQQIKKYVKLWKYVIELNMIQTVVSFM